MRLLKLFLAIFVFSFLVVNFTFIIVHSAKADDDPCHNPDQQQQCTDFINQTQKQLDEVKGQEKTLKSQLDYIDAQTKLTELKIQAANFQIAKLNSEITDLSGRIERISANVDSLSKILLDRIVQTYKYGNVTPIDLLFSSNGFSDLLERLKYIEVAQANDKKVLYQLQATKATYNDQKQDKQTRQTQEEKLKKDLDTYQKQLDQDKAVKDRLLRDTQNNEAVYQSKLQAALAEQAAILQIFDNSKNEVQDGQVSKGQAIGNFILGPSACSQGSHLHFEVHKDNQLQNPVDYLSNHSVSWNIDPRDNIFSFNGSWDQWPINDPIEIEQGYGMTCFARPGCYYPNGAYNGAPHTGIDMFSYSSSTVKAVHDGKLSHGGVACGGGTLLYKRVDHGDGISSYYLHVL